MEILHQWRAGASQGMVHGAEVSDGRCLAGSGDDRRLADLQAACVRPVEPARYQVVEIVFFPQQDE